MGKENEYSKYNVKYNFASDGTLYVQGKDDPLSNMWPVKLKWKKHIFLSSEHIYVYELLKWHGKLNTSTLQILLYCWPGFKAKALGKKLVPEKSRSWMKVYVSKMYSILQAKMVTIKSFYLCSVGCRKWYPTHTSQWPQGYILDDFIWQIDIFPNLDCIFGLKEIMDTVNDLLILQRNEFQIVLAYDTTFQLGDFYVSPLLFRHIYFNGSPIIPLAFLVHDRKFQVSHAKIFFQS